MIVIFHQAIRMYVYKHLALSLVLAFLNDVVRGTPHIIEYIHVVYETNEVAVIEKHISFLYAAVNDMVVIHASTLAPI